MCTTINIILFTTIIFESSIFSDKPQCKPSGHKVLDNPRRNIANFFNPAHPLCDNTLEKAWYKLEHDGLPAELPTECPAAEKCGTQHQMWLRPDSRPSFGDDKVGSVCVTWKTKKKNRICCLWEIPVNVTHCGGFLVYQLTGTKECHVSYCSIGTGLALLYCFHIICCIS